MVDKEFRLDAVGAYGSNGAVRGNSIAVRGNTPQSDRRLRVTSTNAATNRTRVTSTTKTICGVMNDMLWMQKSVAKGPTSGSVILERPTSILPAPNDR